MFKRLSGLKALAVAGLVAVAGLAAPTQAQDFGGRGGGGGGGMFTAGVNSRDLERYQDMLNLTRDQRDTIKALFEGYQEQSRTKGQEMRDKMQDMRDQMRDGGDAASRRGMGQMMTEFRQQRDKMDNAFFTDVQAILTPEQKTVWPKVEMTRRREQNINRGLMSGERADLFRIIEQENLPADLKAKLQPVLDQYAVDLDRELTNRTKIFDENMTKAMDLMGQGDPAQMTEKFEPMLKQAREAAVKVRDVNRRYARQIEELLPEDRKAVFGQAFKQASFPNVYRQTQASRQIVAAQGFADLTEDQKTAIAALKDSHSRDTSALEEKLATATEDSEMKMTADQLMRRLGGGFMMGGRGGQGGGGPGGGQGGNAGGQQRGGQARGNQGGGAATPPGDRNAQNNQGRGGRGGFEDGPVGELRDKARELDRTASDSLKKILRPEQVDRLPQREDGPGGGNGGRGRDRNNANNRT